jgi:8-oxo-dGTP pyrophosphatase MutT (NUDIX family)
LLVYPGENDRPHLILTVRRPELPQHGGQVALPGGAVEAGESVTEAALREAQEEVGIDPEQVRVLGELSPLHIPVSHFALHPVVAVTGRRPDLRLDEREVERILEVPLEQLCDPDRLVVETRQFGGRDYRVPFIRVGGQGVWGATAMILAELLYLIGCPPAPWS